MPFMLRIMSWAMVLVLAAMVAQPAAAARIEAVWQIDLTLEGNPGMGDSFPVTIPTRHQLRMVFSDQVTGSVAQPGLLTTYFGTSDVNRIDRPLAGYTPANPFGAPAVGNDVTIRAMVNPDGLAIPSVRFYAQEASENVGDGSYWRHELLLSVTPRFGFDNRHTRPEDLWDMLAGLQANPENFSVDFMESGGVWTRHHALMDGAVYWGAPTLTSLRRLDVPEPPAFMLIGLGLVSAGLMLRRRVRR